MYLLLGTPLILAAIIGWWRAGRQARGKTVAILMPLALGMLLSLAYTLTYPAGVMTSWGKNIYPLLPLCAVAGAVGWNRCAQRFGKLVSVLAVIILAVGCIWGLTQLAGA